MQLTGRLEGFAGAKEGRLIFRVIGGPEDGLFWVRCRMNLESEIARPLEERSMIFCRFR